uniref:Sugar ABC transporter ATP-binding protein n=1 Tax=Candidatus Caldatribacterium saccharofermentans TaxID=1454753 RepID=A0A7V4TYI7_9BACT
MSEYFLEMRNINKTFPGVRALKNVTFCVRKGEIHGLVGENGAGKTTLMNVLGGVLQPDSGEIFINGQRVVIRDPHEAQRIGIAFIHQEPTLFNFLSIARNIFVSNLPTNSAGRIDFPTLYQRSRELLERVGLDRDPRTLVKDLTLAEKQMVEIAKALSFKSQIFVLDEPTSPLTDKEVENLFRIIRELKSQGETIIYISHRLNEIFEICDSVTVMRDGEVIDTMPVSQTNKRELIRKMVGRELSMMFPQRNNRKDGEIILVVENLTKEPYFRNVSFSLRKGEILGIFGLVGAGRSELARTIVGDYRRDSGRVLLEGREVHFSHPREAIAHGVGFLTEDRRSEGLAVEMEVYKNISMAIFWNRLRQGFRLDLAREREIAEEYVRSLRIVTPTIYQLARNLSGGNQQKVVVAKWLCASPKVLIVDEPTRGIDVGAKAEIYHIVADLAERGMGIIFISSEIEEILGMSDRILVMYEGEVTAEIPREEATQEKVMYYATGGEKVHV